MKIGSNDICPCGSGKKYKRCCMERDKNSRLVSAMFEVTNNIKNDARIKRCLHPNKSECDGKVVKAHAVQKNGVLKKIAENGMVVTLDGTKYNIFQTSVTKGKAVATTFTGFCKYHDKILFRDIEDKDFVCSEKQIFLLTYRTMAWHYHKKEEQENATKIIYDRMKQRGYDATKMQDTSEYVRGLKLAIQDNEKEKNAFDKALLAGKYDVINSCVWEIPYEISFCVSMMHELEYDIMGRKIIDLENEKYLPKIYLNIFPVNGKSFCIWSWLSIYDETYKTFSEQFMELEEKDKKNYLNNNLPRWSDSIVISPRLWERWGNAIQQALVNHANFDLIYRVMEEEEDFHAYVYMDTPWCFFEK